MHRFNAAHLREIGRRTRKEKFVGKRLFLGPKGSAGGFQFANRRATRKGKHAASAACRRPRPPSRVRPMTTSTPTGRPHWSPRLIEAALALHDNRLDVAERMLKAHLKADPFDARAIRMLAELAARLGRMTDAENLLRRAVELAPNFTAARANLALVVGRLGRPAEALALLEDVFAAEPDQIGHANLKAATLGRLGDFDEAIGLYEAVLAKAPRQPRVWLSYGHMLKTVGRQADGIAAYRRAIALKPGLGEAWWSLANLKTVRFDAADTAAMLTALEEPDISDEDRFHLDFALGKAMHDAGDAASAFAHYDSGNRLRRATQPYRAAETARLVDRI